MVKSLGVERADGVRRMIELSREAGGPFPAEFSVATTNVTTGKVQYPGAKCPVFGRRELDSP